MELLYLYGVFAVSGALTTLVTVWYPAYQIAKYMDPSNLVVVHRNMYYAMCLAFSIVLAPALIIIVLNTEAFTKQFVMSILGKEK